MGRHPRHHWREGGDVHLQLLSDSCTTGWAHWGHGELWLTPDSIVRVPKRSLTLAAAGRGALAGAVGGAGAAVALEMVRGCRTFRDDLDVDPVGWSEYVESHPDHVRIDLADVVAASLRVGVTTSRVKLETADAPSVKLLWMRNPVAVRALKAALHGRLG